MALFLLAALHTAVPSGANTLTDFGYYYAMEPASMAVLHREVSTGSSRGSSASLPAVQQDQAAAAKVPVGVLTTLCTQPGAPNSTITVSYTGVVDGKADDYIGLWCPCGSNATYVSYSWLSCKKGGACPPAGSVCFSSAMLAVAGRMQHSIGACEFRYCRNNDDRCGPAQPANFVADSGPVAVGSCCPPPPAVAQLPPAVAAHSTTTFVDPSSFPAAAAALAAANISVVISGLDSLFLDPKNNTLLAKDWPKKWHTYWDTISPHSDSILAFYPVDEPQPAQIASGAYGTLVKAIKTSAPHIPIAAVVTPSAVRGIEFSAYSLPPEVDWIGGDQYSCWAEDECEKLGECCWMNRTIPHNLNVLRDYAKKRGGKMVVVPDGVASATSEQRKHGQKNLPTAKQQAVRAARDQKYCLFAHSLTFCLGCLREPGRNDRSFPYISKDSDLILFDLT